VPAGRPRIGVLGLATSSYASLIQAAGGRPIRRELLGTIPRGGVALRREWVADQAEAFGSIARLEALLVGPARTEDLPGLLLAAVRLNVPTVFGPAGDGPFGTLPYALGLASLDAEPAELVVRIARSGEPRFRELIDNFSLANALRAGVAAGGGPELLVHLAALAREAGVAGFDQMIRVLAPETPEVAPEWLQEHGVFGLLSSLDDTLHDVPTVAGNLKETLPPAPSPPDGHARLVFVRARASGAEAVCRVRQGVTEAAGECRVFDSEDEAVAGVGGGEIGEGTMLAVGGCGPRGGPGLLRLDALGRSMREAGLDEVPVLSDGLAPMNAAGTWISLFTPEATESGVIALLRDGDTLRIDLTEGRIRTGIGARELGTRSPGTFPDRAGTAYAARYASVALPALEGAGFG
jgi:dihydroxy-acid dehydratase